MTTQADAAPIAFARTRIQPPRPRADLVARPALENTLAAALASANVTLLAAPAGSGKTVAMSRQLARLAPGTAAAWVSLDEDDDAPLLMACLIAALDRRGLIERRPHPRDGRAVGLYLTPAGHALAQETEKIVVEMENELAGRLSERERATLQRLLQKFYLRGRSEARGAA